MTDLVNVIQIFYAKNPQFKSLTFHNMDDLDDIYATLNDFEDLLVGENNVLKISDFTEQAKTLPFANQQQFNALSYLFTLIDFMNTIAGDGLFAVFYNQTGEQINLFRDFLKAYHVEIYRKFEPIYQMLVKKYQFAEQENLFDTDRFNMDGLNETEENLLDELEEEINSHWEIMWQEIIASYNGILTKNDE